MSKLRNLIINVLHMMTHTELSSTPLRVAGLEVPIGEGLSKRQRIDLALDGLDEKQLAHLALRFGQERNDFNLDEAARKVLEAGDPPLTHIARRDIARVFGDDLAGELGHVSLAEKFFDLSSPFEMFAPSDRSLRARIERHMDLNPGDWSVEQLFGEIGAFDCSRARFAAMIEEAVHPLARSGEEQQRVVAALNKILTRDGYHLIPDGELSGYPVFAFRPVSRGVTGRPKNLIFASRGPKPEIGFADAINNDIVILSNEESCLVYDRPIGSNGLLWSEMVTWWGDLVPGANAAALGARLRESLSSDGERNLFATYFKKYRPSLGERLPALLPQVYLHYDPGTVKTLRHRLPLPRQRMDFLLLLPERQRIVVEVDGKHHFSENDVASLKIYAEMVSADRELRLAGYEIYRFGSNELVGDGSEARIIDFFDGLFRLHGIGKS